jgi:hypothetical protein
MLSTFAIFAIVFLVGLAAGGLLILVACSLFPERPSPAHGQPKLYFARVEWQGFTIEGDIKIVNINAGQQVKVTARFKDKFGNPAPIQPGSAAWASNVNQNHSRERSEASGCGHGGPGLPFAQTGLRRQRLQRNSNRKKDNIP